METRAKQRRCFSRTMFTNSRNTSHLTGCNESSKKSAIISRIEIVTHVLYALGSDLSDLHASRVKTGITKCRFLDTAREDFTVRSNRLTLRRSLSSQPGLTKARMIATTLRLSEAFDDHSLIGTGLRHFLYRRKNKGIG